MADEPRLYLVTPPVVDPDHMQGVVEAALNAGDVACLRLVLPPLDAAAAKRVVRQIGAVVQPHGTALILDVNPQLVVRAEADGLHVAGTGDDLAEALAEATRGLKPDRIVGAGFLPTRHDAMAAGEANVDYVMFGEAGPDGVMPPPELVHERVAWWAEIFTIPCVGLASSADEVASLVTAGADFVALGPAIFADADTAAAAVREADYLLTVGPGGR